MTLSQLIKKHRKQFYRQDWFDGLAFMELQEGPPLDMPRSLGPEPNGIIASAVDLAVLYLANPKSPIWERFLWTADFDDLGQRVYVGGLGQANKPGFQIHRHLKVTGRTWAWPRW